MVNFRHTLQLKELEDNRTAKRLHGRLLVDFVHTTLHTQVDLAARMRLGQFGRYLSAIEQKICEKKHKTDRDGMVYYCLFP